MNTATKTTTERGSFPADGRGRQGAKVGAESAGRTSDDVRRSAQRAVSHAIARIDEMPSARRTGLVRLAIEEIGGYHAAQDAMRNGKRTMEEAIEAQLRGDSASRLVRCTLLATTRNELSRASGELRLGVPSLTAPGSSPSPRALRGPGIPSGRDPSLVGA